MRWLWLLNRQSYSFLCNKCIRVAYVYRHNLFSLTHTTLLLLVITSPQKVCFCQGTRTFPPVSTDWWQIGGCAVGSAATSDSFISGSTADTAGMLIKGRLGHRCRLWCENHKAPRYKNIEPCGNESVQGFSRPLVTHKPLSAELWATFFCSVFQHSCSTEQREKGDSFCSACVSWCSRLKSLHHCYLFQAAISIAAQKLCRRHLLCVSEYPAVCGGGLWNQKCFQLLFQSAEI